MKVAWIPRKKFFEQLKSGTLPPELQKKYKHKKNFSYRGKYKTRKVKSLKGIKKRYNKSNKKTRTLKTFTIYVEGTEVDQMTGYSALTVERQAAKKYHTKQILLSEEK